MHIAPGTLPASPEFCARLSVCKPFGNPSEEVEEEGRALNWLEAKLSSTREVNALRSGIVPESALLERSSVVSDLTAAAFVSDDGS